MGGGGGNGCAGMGVGDAGYDSGSGLASSGFAGGLRFRGNGSKIKVGCKSGKLQVLWLYEQGCAREVYGGDEESCRMCSPLLAMFVSLWFMFDWGYAMACARLVLFV